MRHRISSHMTSLALSATALFGLSACRSWEPIETIASLAFADDDSAVAMMVFRFESKPNNNPLMGTTLKRNMRHQLFVESPTGAGRTALTPEIPGQNGNELYYMKSSGYFVSAAVSPEARWFNKIAGGQVTEIARVESGTCESRHFDVVPSPDGDHLAILMAAPGCPSMSGPASPTGGYGATEPITVTFLDAATLDELQSQTLTVSTMNLEWTWRPAGDFVVSSGDKSWSLDVGRAPSNTTKPRCFWPKTASSQWSSTGTFIESVDLDVVVSGQNAAAAFGCQ
ncbi:MAG TPA: hypothetical protein PK095_19260 [Myxococcota bacterium]|nr:hypothetical protein [Myxococcota bacterium]